MRPSIWNILSIVMILATFCLCGVFGLILMDSSSPLNPFPPPTLVSPLEPILLPTATATWKARSLPPTWTPEGTSQPSQPTVPPDGIATSTIAPTSTGFVISSFTPSATMTNTPTVTPTPTSTFTITPTPTKTRTPTITMTPTLAATSTFTQEPSPTPTP